MLTLLLVILLTFAHAEESYINCTPNIIVIENEEGVRKFLIAGSVKIIDQNDATDEYEENRIHGKFKLEGLPEPQLGIKYIVAESIYAINTLTTNPRKDLVFVNPDPLEPEVISSEGIVYIKGIGFRG
jgi:hypothetical protein